MLPLLLAVLPCLAPRVAPAQTSSPDAVLALRRMLTSRDWPGLERELERRRIGAGPGSLNESPFVYAFDVFVSSDSGLRPHLDAWIAARPASVLPRVARGLYFVQMAQAAQDLAVADSSVAVHDEGVRERDHWLALAHSDARAAVRIDFAEPMAHMIYLNMIPLEIDSTEAASALTSILAVWPAAVHPRVLYAEQLEQRRGNPPERLAQFVDSAQRFAVPGSRVPTLGGLPAFEAGLGFTWTGKHDEAIAQFTRALAYGEYWRYRYERGREYYRVDSLHKALIDLNRALAERPGYVRALAGRAAVLGHLARKQPGNWRASAEFRRAESDRRVALALDARDRDVNFMLADAVPQKRHPDQVAEAAVSHTEEVRAVPPPVLPVSELLALRQMLLDRRFAELDSAFAARASAARANPANETLYAYAFDVFISPDTALRPHLDAWVRRDSSRALSAAARATYFVARAQAARGTGVAAKVTSEQRRTTDDWLALASADARRAMTGDTTDIMAHLAMLDAARLANDDSVARSVLRDALQRQPASMLVRMRYMSSLRPRWGGSPGAMEQFASAQQAAAGDNGRMPVLLGLTAFDEAQELDEDGQQATALELYTKALSHGDYWRIRLERAQVYFRIGEPEKAMTDLNRAIAERPFWAESLAWRALACARLASRSSGPMAESLMRRGRADLRLASVLDRDAYLVNWMREHYPALATEGAGSP